jgi:beta-glucosidase
MGTGNAGEYAYGDEVAFPFGYGKSYTQFDYSDMYVVYNQDTDRFEVTVTVTNSGNMAGKETVQVYFQAPYTQYDKDNGVEKASVNLVGFKKTAILEVGESVELTIEVDKRDIASYDAYGYGTYILDEGTYYLTAATDSHNAINNILAAKDLTAEQEARMDGEGDASVVGTWTQAAFDATTYATSLNGTEITDTTTERIAPIF